VAEERVDLTSVVITIAYPVLDLILIILSRFILKASTTGTRAKDNSDLCSAKSLPTLVQPYTFDLEYLLLPR
jgi:hypothetical protein